VTTSIRFRDSWFIRAGIAIVGISAVPLLAVTLAGLVSGKEFGAGPTGICLLTGAFLGSSLTLLGTASVIVQRAAVVRQQNRRRVDLGSAVAVTIVGVKLSAMSWYWITD
jgi:hypothetical protein